MERAQQAIEDGRFEDAEAALNEAREIGKDAQDLEVLEAALAARKNPVLELPPDLPLSDTNVSESSMRSPLRGWAFAAAAVVIFAGAGLAYARYWPAPASIATVAPTIAASPVVPVGTLGAPATDRIDRLTIVRETITASIATPRFGENELPKLPPYPAPPIAAPAPEPDPVVMAVNRPEPEPPPSTPLESRPTIPVESQPGPAAPPPPLRAFIPDSSPMTALRPEAPPARVENAPAPRETAAPAEPAVRDETVVLSVLQRYETAYSNLDAAAASAVWPAVDRSALARAFNGLASQRVSLGDCDISVNGPSARATCSGSATWRPKVGGGSHTENRRWNFELRKAGENWKIERAVIR